MLNRLNNVIQFLPFCNMLRETVKTGSYTIHKRPQSTVKAQYLLITQITTNTISVRAVLPDPQCFGLCTSPAQCNL